MAQLKIRPNFKQHPKFKLQRHAKILNTILCQSASMS